MGCDIHVFNEKKANGKWVSADEWKEEYGEMRVPYETVFHGRNYNLFGTLSRGVRSVLPVSFEQRGLPIQLDDRIKGEMEDCHSVSHLYLSELEDLLELTKSTTIKISGMKEKLELDALNDSIASGAPDWNLLYPYCGWSSSSAYVEFSVDLPMHFIIGSDLEEIIEGMKSKEAERITFGFDS